MSSHPQERRPNLLARMLLRLGLAEEPSPASGRPQPRPAAAEAEDARTLAARLTELLENARPIPLTEEVRLDKEAIYDIVDRIRTATSAGALLVNAEAVEDAVRDAMPVPLTNQVRLPRERVAELVRGLLLAS
jgi:hypothetical protein